MDRLDVHRVDATYRCDPRGAPSCGALVPVDRTTCAECGRQQQRPLAPAPGRLVHDVVLYDDGRPILLAGRVSAEAAGFVKLMAERFTPRKVWGKPRLSGLGDRQAMFGTIQPQPLRRRYGCRRSNVARNTDPARWEAIAAELHATLGEHLPDVAMRNVTSAAPIADTWKWPGTGWTSGVLNFTQLLPYHRDAGNLPHSWSAMIGARAGVEGGHLHLPEYDVTIAIDHRSLTCFPGGDITHGVTPMRLTRLGWRVTAVFYGLRAVRNCRADAEAEIDRAAMRATERARVVARGES